MIKNMFLSLLLSTIIFILPFQNIVRASENAVSDFSKKDLKRFAIRHLCYTLNINKAFDDPIKIKNDKVIFTRKGKQGSFPIENFNFLAVWNVELTHTKSKKHENILVVDFLSDKVSDFSQWKECDSIIGGAFSFRHNESIEKQAIEAKNFFNNFITEIQHGKDTFDSLNNRQPIIYATRKDAIDSVKSNFPLMKKFKLGPVSDNSVRIDNDNKHRTIIYSNINSVKFYGSDIFNKKGQKNQVGLSVAQKNETGWLSLYMFPVEMKKKVFELMDALTYLAATSE